MNYTKIKIDLDIKNKNDAIKEIIQRTQFLIDIKVLILKDIEKVILLKKSNYSYYIIYKKQIKDPKDLIIIQSILGDDYKRVGICFRDFSLGLNNWNRLFNYKRYINGEYKIAIKEDITKQIIKEIKKNMKNERNNII